MKLREQVSVTNRSCMMIAELGLYTLTGIKLDENLLVFILGQDFWIQSPPARIFGLRVLDLKAQGVNEEEAMAVANVFLYSFIELSIFLKPPDSCSIHSLGPFLSLL